MSKLNVQETKSLKKVPICLSLMSIHFSFQLLRPFPATRITHHIHELTQPGLLFSHLSKRQIGFKLLNLFLNMFEFELAASCFYLHLELRVWLLVEMSEFSRSRMLTLQRCGIYAEELGTTGGTQPSVMCRRTVLLRTYEPIA